MTNQRPSAANPKAKRAAIYARVSLDRTGQSLSPERQVVLCQQAAKSRGWEVVEVFEDRDISGWKEGAKRPAFDRLQTAVRQGRVDVVMAYSLSRLGRRATNLLEFVAFLRRHDCELSVLDLDLDSSSPLGKMFLTITAAFAELEAELTSERVSSAHQVAAQKGEMHTGGARGFGYERDGTQRPEEAAIVVEVANRLLAGESLRQVAFDLNARKIETTLGKEWSGPTLRQMIGAPRLTGLRSYGKEMYEGSWVPILDRATWTALQTKLDHGKPGRPRSVRVHLLSGIAVCGKCGGSLKTLGFRPKGGKKFERYQCVKQPGYGNCGGIAIAKDSLDRYVVNRWLDFMSEAQIRPSEDRSREKTETLVENLRGRLERLSVDYYVNGTIGSTEFFASRDPLSKELDEAEKALSALAEEAAARVAAVRPGDRAGLSEWWDQANPAERRDAIKQAVLKIVVHPARRRGGNRFDTSRVKIYWHFDMYIKREDARWDALTDEEREQEQLEIGKAEDAVHMAEAAAG
jgi:site-specific DNA recombinase